MGRHQTDDSHPDGDDKAAKQDRADHYKRVEEQRQAEDNGGQQEGEG